MTWLVARPYLVEYSRKRWFVAQIVVVGKNIHAL